MNFAIALALIVVLAVANVSLGLQPVLARRQAALSTASKSKIFDPLFMSDAEDDERAFVKPETDAEAKLKFDMNKRVRLGRSRDQDGKSNIWSIEPTMEVEEGDGESDGGQGKKNLLIAGAVIGTAIACLPLFSAFSKLFPDPADF